MKLEVVIPIRGGDTELFEICLESVYHADWEGVEVRIANLYRSEKQAKELKKMILTDFYAFPITAISYPIWNKPVALNYELKRSDADWFGMLDGDYLIPTYFFQKIMDNFEDGCFIQCRGYDLPMESQIVKSITLNNRDHLTNIIEAWACKPRPKADFGGFQCFPTKIGKKVRGYDERFKLYGGMHHEFRNRLLNYGLKEKRLHGNPIILHQWHENRLVENEGLTEPEIERERNKHKKIIRELGDRVRANEDIEWGSGI